MSSGVGGLLYSLKTIAEQGVAVLDAIRLVEAEKSTLETRVNSLMDEVAKLKETVKKLEEIVATPKEEVKSLEGFEKGLAAYLQNANSCSAEQPVPVELPIHPSIKAVDEKLRVQPNNPRLLFAKANALMNLKDHNGAIICLEEAAEKYGIETNSQFREIQARNLLALGRQKEALETIQKAIRANPTFGINYFVEAEIYIAMGDKDKAKVSAEIAETYGVNVDKLNLK